MLYLTTETDLAVGQPCQSHAQSPLTPHFAVVFEDDGQTGYFYALDTRNEQQPIATALHIYNVDNVTDAQLLGKIQICWHHRAVYQQLSARRVSFWRTSGTKPQQRFPRPR